MKPIELVEAAIERIERINPQLNAVITPMYDLAREAAAGELPEGPFTGVPFLLKDLGIFYAGVRTTSGSAFTRDYVPHHDSELVVRLKQAGLVVVGKTNTPEFGLICTTEPHLFGPAHNPWDIAKTTGGSSGGSAAAVASGMVPAAYGNDGGGSIHIPASCCGVFGLKPTRARNPLGPRLGDVMSGLAIEHALTRSVRDSAALLDATSGTDPGDPYPAPPPARPFLSEVGADPGRLRIAYTTLQSQGVKVHGDCARAVEDAAELCAELGHEVEEKALDINYEMATPLFMVLWSAGAAWTADGMAMAMGKTPTPDQFEPLSWALIEMGRGFNAPQYLLAVSGLQRIARSLAHQAADFDLWLTPTLARATRTPGHLRVASRQSPVWDRARGRFRALHPDMQHDRTAGYERSAFLEPGGPSHRSTFHRQVRGRGHPLPSGGATGGGAPLGGAAPTGQRLNRTASRLLAVAGIGSFPDEDG